MVRPLFWLIITLISGSYLGKNVPNGGNNLIQSKSFSTELETMDGLHHLFRRVLANYFWIKADDYMHNGDPLIQPDAQGKFQVIGYSFANNREIVPLLSCAIFLDPEFIQAIELLGSHLSHHLGEIERGIEYLEMGINLNGSKAESYLLYLTLGEIYLQNHKFQKALPVLKTAEGKLKLLKISEENKGQVIVHRQMILSYLAFCHFELKKFSEARAYYDLAGGFSENNRLTHFFKTGDFVPLKGEADYLASLPERDGGKSKNHLHTGEEGETVVELSEPERSQLEGNEKLLMTKIHLQKFEKKVEHIFKTLGFFAFYFFIYGIFYFRKRKKGLI